jgi:tetratricopeptide (TPR) repeat protein
MPLRHVRICVALGLWIGTAALFWPIRHHDFVLFDDPRYVSRNFGLLEDGLTLAGLHRTFTTVSNFNWHPLTTISYAVDYQLHGQKAGGYLLTNLLLHATATLLLFLALDRLTGALWRSAFVAAVFGIHPLHVESVAWVSERKDVLSAVFFAAILLVYAGVARAPTRRGRLILFALLAVGLLAKPMLVTTPFVLLLLDFWPLGRIPGRGLRPALQSLVPLVVEKLPLFALCAASSAATYLVQSFSGAVPSLELFPLPARLLNTLTSYSTYVERAFWPTGLAFYYPTLLFELSPGRALPGAAMLVGVTAASVVLRRRAPYLLMGWLWFVGMLVPVIGLVQVGSQAMADRYTYLPLIGLTIAVTWGSFDLLGSRRSVRIALAGVAVAVLSAFAVVSVSQIKTWRNTQKMAERAIRVTRHNAGAHFLLAGALLEQGHRYEARSELEASLAINPNQSEAHSLMGEMLEQDGQPENAVVSYREALRCNPSLLETRLTLAKLLVELGRPEEALKVLQNLATAGRAGGGAEAHVLIGRAFEAQGDPSGAMAQYEQSLGLWPNFPEAHANLGLLLAKQDRLPEAETQLRRALELGLDKPELHFTLGDVLQRQGRMAEAAAEFRAAVRLRPDWAVASNNLAWILATEEDSSLRRPEEAVTLAESAARGTSRRDPAVLDTLAVAYAAAGRHEEALTTAREALALARAQQRTDLIRTLDQRVHSYANKGSASAP